MRRLDVLIVGAGVAGSTLAALLGRDGHRVVVVEKDQSIRSSGNPVDVRGEACRVLASLGVLSRVRERATLVDRAVFVDDAGCPVGTLRTQRRPDDFEVSRSSLAAILVDAARDVVDLRFGETIATLNEHDQRADVEFERSAPDAFDLVVGADGLHSTIRRMTFGPENRFVRSFGMYVAGFPLGAVGKADPSTVLVHNSPGRMAAIHPGADDPVAALIFRSPRLIDCRDQVAVMALVRNTYQDCGWLDRELLEGFAAADDPYIDQVSRVTVRPWSAGHVTLLGDAASCVSLFGEGSSSAIIGARRLATELATGTSLDGALVRYERQQSSQVRRGQRLAGLASHLLVPSTRGGIAFRNTVLRLSGLRDEHPNVV